MSAEADVTHYFDLKPCGLDILPVGGIVALVLDVAGEPLGVHRGLRLEGDPLRVVIINTKVSRSWLGHNASLGVVVIQNGII